MAKELRLVFRKRHSKDDPFLIRTSLENMGKIYFESTGYSLTEQHIRSLIDSNETTMIEYQKQPVGYYSYAVFPTGQMYWSALVLVKEAHSKGIGSQVVRHVEEEALAKGVRVIDGHVQITNQKALSFWLKHGFQITGGPYSGSVEIRKNLTRPRQSQ